jgi:hypothetical protein
VGTFCAPVALRQWVSYFLSFFLEFELHLETLRRTFVDVAFDHDAHDRFLAAFDLLCQHFCDFGLVLVVLQAVSVAAVDHESLC